MKTIILTSSGSYSGSIFERTLVVFLLLVSLVSCNVLQETVDSLYTDPDLNDTTPPSISFESNPCPKPILGERYLVHLYRPACLFYTHARDEESGIEYVQSRINITVRCQSGSSELTRGFTSEWERFDDTLHSDGRVLMLAISESPLRIFSNASTDRPYTMQDNVCEGTRVLGINGFLETEARNSVGLTTNEELELYSIECGRRGESCCDGTCIVGDSCREGICSIPCSEGASCRADALGECRRGTTQCRIDEEECQAGPPAEEICNGLDDDCDGDIDEGIADTTSMETPSGCEADFQISVSRQCVDGDIVEVRETYCTAVGGECGNGPFTPCNEFIDDSSCAPGRSCLGDPGDQACRVSDPPGCMAPPNCWRPSDVGTNCWTGH